MHNSLLDSVLNLKQTEKDSFRADYTWRPPLSRAVYGGVIITQALRAASSTVTSQYDVNSLHAYYLRPGVDTEPVEYYVARLRDGATIATRVVQGFQKGSLVVYMMVSYHKREQSEVSYQYKMPSVPPPDQLESYDEIVAKYTERSEASVLSFDAGLPIQIKPVDPSFMIHQRLKPNPNIQPQKPHRIFWIGLCDQYESDDTRMYEYVVALLSDWGTINGALQPHPFFKPTFVASLDHSICFHRKFDPRKSPWLLFDCDSPTFKKARAYMTGRLWTEDGLLVASFTQEALIRGSVNKL